MTSRVARMPIELPKGVEVVVLDQLVTVKGNKGTMKRQFPSCVGIHLNGNIVNIDVQKAIPTANAQAGTARALINNMVKGVSVGFERKLLLVGVGYRANVQGQVINLALGFSHPVNFPIPEGITIETPTQTEIVIKGADKHMVGQVAANIRDIRPPEPYKGKGVRYADEVIVLKETKKK